MSHTILITAATKGIGLASTQMLIAQGYEVVGVARSQQETFPGKLYLYNLESKSDASSILKQISENHSISGIVNNAGIALSQPLGEY